MNDYIVYTLTALGIGLLVHALMLERRQRRLLKKQALMLELIDLQWEATDRLATAVLRLCRRGQQAPRRGGVGEPPVTRAQQIRARKEEEKLFEGLRNIMDYDLTMARKAVANRGEDE